MSFENDATIVREAHDRLQQVRGAIIECHDALRELDRYINDLENNRILSHEEFLRAERHIHPISEEHRGELNDAYEQYRLRAQRERDESLSRAHVSQTRAQEAVHKAEQLVRSERELQTMLVHRLEQLHEALTHVRSGLERSPEQLTPQHVQESRHKLEAHEWGSPRQ